MPIKFKTLIVEDDEINVRLLTLLLAKYFENIEVVGVAKNSLEFTDKYLALKPDILLLDIDLGEQKNTLEILHDIGDFDCEIVITSSHKNYAIKAINEYHVSSYIVKPITINSLNKAIKTCEKKLFEKRILQNTTTETNFATDIIGVPTPTSIDIIEIKDILYLEADGKYTVFHLLDGHSKVGSKNIGYYENFLPQNLFFRIHHKFIVNIKAITKIIRSDGNYCLLKNGKSLSVANRRIENLRKFLQLK